MSLSAEHSAMLKTWAKTFATALLASFLALGTPPWELEGAQWLSILWSGLLALAMVVYNWLDPKDPRYGRANTVLLNISPASVPTPDPAPAAKPELKVAPAPKAEPAKKAPAKKAPAPKKAPAKRTAKKATDKK